MGERKRMVQKEQEEHEKFVLWKEERRRQKEEVDKQQEEMEGLTWADRWYQNKQVQKVVQHSQLMSKVRSNIKIKLRGSELLTEPSTSNSPLESGNSGHASPTSTALSSTEKVPIEKQVAEVDLPETITGSMKEYATIVGKTAEQLENEQLEDFRLNGY